MSIFGFLGDIRITALLEYHPFFCINKKCMKECNLDLQMDVFFQMNIIVLKMTVKNIYIR